MAGFKDISNLSKPAAPASNTESRSAPGMQAPVITKTSPAQVTDPLVTRDFVTKPAAPIEFRGLSVGPQATLQYEQNQAIPVDGSDPLLRRLSPFMLRVEPPLIYGEGTPFTDAPGNTISVETYGLAHRITRDYENARSVISRSGLGSLPGSAETAPEFIVQSAAGGATRSIRTGGVSRDLRDGKLGEPAISDFMAAADIARQVTAAVQTPPLVLLINPESLQVNYTKLQQFQDRTRYGYMFHTWGEEQPKLSISARCGAFYSGGRGVSYASKRDSASWQNLMNAFHLYQNNGYIYDTLGKSNAHHMVGVLSIRFDQWVYYGHMESFSWAYDETHQNGGIAFTMEFTASAMVDTAQSPSVVLPMRSPTVNPGDPRYQGIQSQSFNQPGNFSIGSDGLTTQGRQVGVGDALRTLIPGAFGSEQASPTGVGTPLSTGNQGFQQPFSNTSPGQRQVIISDPTVTSPFGTR